MAGEKKFFLGLGGEQTGPYSDEEINTKIRSGEVKPDSLVWYEGLGEWQRVDAIVFFQSAFGKGRSENAAPQKLLGEPKPPAANGELQTVFSAQEAVFFRRRGPRPVVLAVGVGVLLAASGLFWYLNSDEEFSMTRTAAPRPDPNSRPARLKKADSEYLIKPATIPEEFGKLIAENATDEVGRKAVEALEGIYKKKHRVRDLADLYLRVGRYQESIPLYVEDKSFQVASQAALQGFAKYTDAVARRKMLVTAIELMTGPMRNVPASFPYIETLEKEFPNEPNPFAYYLLSEEKKMTDIFNRISYFFVENLLNHVKAEFPLVKLSTRPVVSIVREVNGKYRIAGSYKGNVTLSLDQLRNIRFEYWMVGTEWHLVGTNITAERQAWVKNNRVKFLGSALSGPAMLSYLENAMRAQFPGVGLHEKVTREQMADAARETALAK